MKNIGILFPGEMGSALAVNLNKGGFTVLSCTTGRSKRTHSAAVDTGIQLLNNIEEVIIESDVVCSLVPPEHAISTATVFADAVVKTGQKPLFVDCNSVSPATVRAIAAQVRNSGVECIDGVFIGSAALIDTKTVLYLSGNKGKYLAEKLASALNTMYLGDTAGDASAFKMCFAGFNKGLIALFLEIACASGRTANLNELITCLENFYPGTIKTIRRLLPSYPQHAHRRVKEIEEIIMFLDEYGQKPYIMPGVVDVLRDFSELFDERQGHTGQTESIIFEDILQLCINAGMLSHKI